MPGEHSLSSPNLPRDKSYYKCRKCRCILFSSDYIVNAHGKQMDTEEFTTCSALSKDQTVAYLRDALPPWIEDLIHEV